MNNTYTRLLAVAGAAVLFCANANAAYSSMNSQVSNASSGVIDLTPDDGQAAGFTIESDSIELEAVLSVQGLYAQSVGTTGGSTRVSYTSYSATASHRLPGNELYGFAHAYKSMTGTDSASYRMVRWLSITVAPHSLFTYSGDYSLFTYGDGVQAFGISAGLEIDLGDDDNWGEYGTWEASGTSDFSKKFWLGYANDTDTAQSIGLRVVSTGSMAARPEMLSAVPEPSSALMFVAGIGLLGFAARRARRA